MTRLIQSELFFKNAKRREFGKKTASPADADDPVTRLFGTAMPSDVPESTAWWQRQTKDLLAASDDAEMGLMQVMVTLTANDSNPEMLAAIRRGPLSAPTSDEMIEYLLARKRRDQERPPYEHYSLEHVLSFQRRVKAVKESFLKRGVYTPLGIVQDFWDRTEAQMRGALHMHCLVWFLRRVFDSTRDPIAAIQRTLPGSKPAQRPRGQIVEALSPSNYKEDEMYIRAHCGRVTAEMVRPSVPGPTYGGFTYEKLRIAGLARHIQTRMYLHSCSPVYCLKNRSSCRFHINTYGPPPLIHIALRTCVASRFFFPCPAQPQQQFDQNCERIALQRRLEADDQWLSGEKRSRIPWSPIRPDISWA